ncbi:ATP-binding protein [Rhodopirellula sp. JC639]|uniref:ATP-binding protein n=1 Tax=Stieleria mannarensis TaxID=2755585 RepID=UPI001600F091|nr:ATP-binding protein [Rhodopirellula sp. JC639]
MPNADRRAPDQILVVEDDDDTRANLCDILELDGYSVSGVSTVAETLAHRNLDQFTTIILDRHLPDGTADDLLPRLNQLAPDAMCIVVTGDADLGGTITALREGASDYIVKPIRPDALRASLTRIRQLAEAEHRAAQAERLAAIGEVVASVGHESRNALQCIKSRVDLIRMDAGDNAALLDDLTAIEKACDGLQCMFEELREFSALIELHPRPCSLKSIVQAAIDSLRLSPNFAGVTVELEVPDHVVVLDPIRIEQVFRNLIENAAGAGAGRIRIVAEQTTIRNECMMEIAVHDNGAGFSKHQREQAFEPFFTTKKTGTGLGLAICKRIIDQHGGRIAIVPRVTAGATISFSLQSRSDDCRRADTAQLEEPLTCFGNS